jgi:hypothetical protein
MSHLPVFDSLPYEDRVNLALYHMKFDASVTPRCAAAMYNVSRRALDGLGPSGPSQCDTHAGRSKLSKLEKKKMMGIISQL